MASLDDPRATLKRARKDLANLKDTISQLHSGEYQDIVFAKEKAPIPGVRGAGITMHMLGGLKSVSVDIGVITGQLRAALDQLVYALFELRTGQAPPKKRRLQFPICEKLEDFRSRIKPDLEGIGVNDIALIESMQPYHDGRHWLREIKFLAEEHKHRKAIYIRSDGRATISAHATDTTEANVVRLPISGAGMPRSMYVKTPITAPVTFADGSPVVEKLQILEAEIAYVVDAFEPLFDS